MYALVVLTFIGDHVMSLPLRQRLLFSVLMSFLMSFLMTAWVTYLNLGKGPGFLSHWQHAFLAAWPAAFIIVVAIGPSLQRLSFRLLQVGHHAAHAMSSGGELER